MKEILKAENLTDKQAEQFIKYKELLVEWNKKINLTAITEEDEIARKHFADSLTPLRFVSLKNKSVIDVGTGAGFPGLPLKIAEPTVTLTLLDSLNKRISFLNNLCASLDLKNVVCIHGRAEDMAKTDMREAYDFAVSRAVASLHILAEFCLPFVKTGGTFIALKGPDPQNEIASALSAIKKLGGALEKTETVSQYGYTHTLVFIKKISRTPKQYPRSMSKIKKSPL